MCNKHPREDATEAPVSLPLRFKSTLCHPQRFQVNHQSPELDDLNNTTRSKDEQKAQLADSHNRRCKGHRKALSHVSPRLLVRSLEWGVHVDHPIKFSPDESAMHGIGAIKLDTHVWDYQV